MKEALGSGHASDCFDEDLANSKEDLQLTQVLALAVECLDPEPKARPSMMQVVKVLETMQNECGPPADGYKFRFLDTESSYSGQGSSSAGSTDKLIPHHHPSVYSDPGPVSTEW